ncbi:MAG: hypothetical protein KJ767_00320 [Nanoarchaeota archaeon]|nr:hypothetical protein [Nanoarchaeota archaeon]
MLQVHIMAMQQIQEMTSIQNKQGIDNALQSLEKSSENFGKFGEIQFPEQNIGKEPCICTMEFEPVCCADGNVYSNACFAKCAGVAVAYKMSVYDINPDNPGKCNPGKKGGIEGALETTKMTAEIKQGESGGQAHEQADTGTSAQEKTTEVAITP